MCGICGIAAKVAPAGSLERTVRRMLGTMTHRGPDGEGVFIGERIVLGHRRLAILDLSENGKQPMSDPEQKFWLTFNGEIYNFKELKQRLKDKYTFRTGTDSEVIIYAYKEWGPDCLKEFRGMFAFALYDLEKRLVFCARDHFGQKPFYYRFKDGEFRFASEVGAVIKDLATKPGINKHALFLYFLHNYRHIPDPYTIYDDVYKLPPASYLVLKLDDFSLNIGRYWQPGGFLKNKRMTAAEEFEQYRNLVKECVDLTSVSDAPVGLLLSGGIDSSTIAALLQKKNLTSFAVGAGRQDPELARARLVAEKFGTRHREIIVEKPKYEDAVKVIKFLGEPLNLLSSIFSTKVAEAARNAGIKVLVGGNGADEMFYGYDGSNRLVLLSRFFRFFGTDQNFLNQIKPWFYRREGRKLLSSLFSPGFQQNIRGVDAGELIYNYCREVDSTYYIDKSYYAGLMTENQHSVTIIGDVTGMMHSVEVRTPFLDTKMFAFASSLPLGLKVGSLSDKTLNKYIMRKGMEGILPKEVVWGKKMGFGYTFSLANLLRSDWQVKAQRHIFEFALPQISYFNRRKVEQLWREHQSGKQNYSPVLWALASLGVWLEEVYA